MQYEGSGLVLTASDATNREILSLAPNCSVAFAPEIGQIIYRDRDPNGRCEYEYWRTIAAEYVPQLVWLLGGEPGEHVIELLARRWSGGRSFDLERVLRDAPFPIRLFAYWPGPTKDERQSRQSVD